MYPFEIVKPMKEELTSLGFKDLTTAKEVNKNISSSQTAVLIVNSVCGCAAANARPGVIQSLINDKIPLQLLTVFAGVDKEATDAARVLMVPFPPSSPCIALFKNGELVHMLERHHIEGRSSKLISENLKQAYNEYC
ncbi:MAG: BrxA/BrxB family bacilliredoxin [Flavobacteriaceae bacterium]|jgi:putative YphP/YqiW family bacilliredoxin|nr:BrxA/BrxB family bacilliredoxin [Pelagibacterales bacterium]MBT4959812.1 BrxA/BrxB family bacilliredoxin [Flavobacteriaceae bacterium]MBT6169758.1 BrxA/BrxB family bacilliredoxin [Flavobacteriaceae bacterium]MBT6447573.1 BrxA/BrxB family bacilliredoxin [Flavobacteriaceae bacterium]MDG1830837.1 BrxA/BrxB family bacilliredoxin [Flavobacteriaceae bacterium]|tara:strand:+ start:35 stop:445 length:411 start_codon:yes stop_codon:yes gene_type:complete